MLKMNQKEMRSILKAEFLSLSDTQLKTDAAKYGIMVASKPKTKLVSECVRKEIAKFFKK